MTRALRSAWLVACNELSDALRSRRAAVILLLYLAVALLSMDGFIRLLQTLEAQVVEMLQIPASGRTGSVTDTLWRSERFRRMVGRAVDDPAILADLMRTPPVALAYGALAFLYTPALVMFIASSRIAEEVGSGAARYALLRTGRLSWCTGKFLGQSAMAAVALLFGAAGAWCVARFRMAAADGLTVGLHMLLWSARVWVYSLAYTGLAMGVSQTTRSGARATSAGVILLVALGVLGRLAERYAGPGWRALWDVAAAALPQSHRSGLFRSQAAYLLPAAAYMLALAWAYMLAGHALFRRRDV